VTGPETEPLSHPELALAPAYALGALDEGERAEYEAHLAGCVECAAEVRALAGAVALLPYALPHAEPPAALRDRVLAAARATARPATPAAPTVPVVVSRPSPRTAAVVPAAPARGIPAWPGWVAAAAGVLLAVFLNGRLGDERAARTAAEGALAEARETVAARDSLLATVLAPDVRTARLAATGRGPDVRVIWNRREGVVVLTAQSLAPAPAGRTYQLWGIPTGGAPRSLGLFAADSGGAARAVLRVPADLTIDVAAVSVEPEGGSQAPTTTPILVGQVGER
jgi:anti-sigma-K factor RskA